MKNLIISLMAAWIIYSLPVWTEKSVMIYLGIAAASFLCIYSIDYEAERMWKKLKG